MINAASEDTEEKNKLINKLVQLRLKLQDTQVFYCFIFHDFTFHLNIEVVTQLIMRMIMMLMLVMLFLMGRMVRVGMVEHPLSAAVAQVQCRDLVSHLE